MKAKQRKFEFWTGSSCGGTALAWMTMAQTCSQCRLEEQEHVQVDVHDLEGTCILESPPPSLLLVHPSPFLSDCKRWAPQRAARGPLRRLLISSQACSKEERKRGKGQRGNRPKSSQRLSEIFQRFAEIFRIWLLIPNVQESAEKCWEALRTIPPLAVTRKQAEYGFKHRTQWVFCFALTELRAENSVSSSQPIICVLKRIHRVFSQSSPSLPQNSVSSLFRNSTLETVFRPFPSYPSTHLQLHICSKAVCLSFWLSYMYGDKRRNQQLLSFLSASLSLEAGHNKAGRSGCRKSAIRARHGEMQENTGSAEGPSRPPKKQALMWLALGNCVSFHLSAPMLHDTVRLSQRYPPYCALWGCGCLNSTWPFGAIPLPFLRLSSLESMRSGGATPAPPPIKGVIAILARYPMKTWQMGAIPPSAILSRKGIARYGRASLTGPLKFSSPEIAENVGHGLSNTFIATSGGDQDSDCRSKTTPGAPFTKPWLSASLFTYHPGQKGILWHKKFYLRKKIEIIGFKNCESHA